MKALYLFVIVVLLSPVCFLQAQMDDRPLIKVDIPFAFTIENDRLPAGSYLIYEISPDHVWRFSSSDHRRNILFHIVTDVNHADSHRPKLIFNHYPTDYVLRQIDAGNMGVTASLFHGKRERQLASNSLPLEIATIDAESE